MRFTSKIPSFICVSLLVLFAFCSCVKEGIDEPMDELPDELSQLTGSLTYSHAGTIYTYDLASQTIEFAVNRKGRLGPFFSPDGLLFTTNNWADNYEGVELWEVASRTLYREFSLETTLTSDERGLKVANGGLRFSGVMNTPGENDLLILNEQGEAKWKIDGEAMRIKDHVWDGNQQLYIVGKLLQGTSEQNLFLAKVPDIENPNVQIIRSFEGEFADLPVEIAVSPDASRIAYRFKTNIWVGSTQADASDHRLCFESTLTLGRPVFSPDGSYLAMAMLNTSGSSRGNLHIAKIPASGSITLSPDGPSKLPGPNSGNSTWTSGNHSSIGWIE